MPLDTPLAPPRPPAPSVHEAPMLPPPGVDPSTLRRFGDAPATRRLIFENTLNALGTVQPVSNARFSLGFENPGYAGPETYSPEEEKRAILEGRTLSRRLQADWVLKDPAGAELARRRTTVAHVPYFSDLGTFVYNGNAYPMVNQMRLRTGVFARRKENGELEAHVNVAKGRTHHLSMDPETGIFRIGIGQAHIPLLPLLQAMGADRKSVEDAWGPELTAANLTKGDGKAIDKLYGKIMGPDGDPNVDHLGRTAAVVKAFGDMTLDPEVTSRTLGKSFANVSADVFLAATKKLIGINKGHESPDDRDSPVYQKVMSPEDLFPEKINLASNVLRKALWKATAKGNLDGVPGNALDDLLHSVITDSGLSSAAEEINPSELFDHQSRVTRMGKGGIPSTTSVPLESRMVQPTHLGYIDILRTPESERVGVDLRFSRGARKGRDGRIYMPVRNARTKQIEYKSPQDLADHALGFPGSENDNGPAIPVIQGGRMRTMRPDRVNYFVPEMEDTFSPLGNLVPGKSSLKGQRAVMAARMITQALPLHEPEAPLVRNATPEDANRSFEEEYAGQMGAVKAPHGGRVVDVTPDKISVVSQEGQQTDIPLYRNFPYNRKTYYHQTPMAKVGDVVNPGDLLATSNYTDQTGTMALGKNVRVAYIPWRGKNYEDALVVSESLAKRMSSEHAYQHGYEWDDRAKKGKNAFVGIFPGAYDRKILDNFSADGVIKPGTIVNEGEPLILAARERETNHKSMLRGRPSFANESVTWDHTSPGEVTDVSVTDKGINVVVKSRMALQEGDKLSGRFGDKGVVAHIYPDSEMPHDKDGQPFELLANPLGMISRINPMQMIEAALGKIAAKTGKPYKLQDFKQTEDAVEYALSELQKNNIPDTEFIVDPRNDSKIPDVFTGNRWFMKLHHTSESKEQGRGFGAYTAEGLPAKGGETGSKRIGMLELSSLLSHGATNVVHDAHMVRGQARPEYWAQYMAGYNPQTPKVSWVHQKFFNQLRGSGINPVKDGPRTHIMALTNKNIDELAGDREIQNAETVDWRDMSPIKGGLFDERLTGGHAASADGGNRWAAIRLHEPLPNPVMEEPIRKILGLTEPKFMSILSGKEELNGKRGPAAIAHALDRINLDQALIEARQDINSGKQTRRSAAIGRFGYLKDAQRIGIHPREWMLDRIPVLPPAYRPVSTMGKAKLPLVDDANLLYKEAFDANQNLKDLSGVSDDVSDERLSLYNAFKAVTGLGQPTHPKNQERQVKGILKHVFGNSPKSSVLHRKLLGSQVDRVGRAVIVPDPNLDMDAVALPENSAWSIYHPDIVRRLVRGGMAGRDAIRAVADRSQAARTALAKELEDGVVLYNRAPTLHRYGIMAARPRLAHGSALRMSPIVYGGFGADNDGDAMQFHAITDPDAKEEALEKMLPSRNLFSVARLNQAHYLPTQEYAGGLYEASARIEKDKPELTFPDVASAIQAHADGQIGVGRRVRILRH